MGGRDNRWRVGGRDGGGVGTTKAAAIALLPKSRSAWRGSQIVPSNVGLHQEAVRIMDNIWIHLGAIKMSGY